MTLTCTAFAGDRRIASGAPRNVAPAVKAATEAGESVLIFDDADAKPVEFDLRGDLDAVLARLPVPVEESAARAVRSSASPPARSPFCRATGTGWRLSPAAPPWPCANWSKAPCGMPKGPTALARRRRPPIAS
jgi:hypothetical protein